MAGRPKGSRAPDYEEKRLALIHGIRRACTERPTELRSMRDIASECGVSVPTLQHYFGGRPEMVRAVLEQSWAEASRYVEAPEDFDGSVAQRVARDLRTFHEAFTRFGLDRLNTWAMMEGLSDAATGPAYLEFVLEPTLASAERWIEHLREAGEIAVSIDPRYAALALYSPCILLFLHQNHLGGKDLRRADIDAFLDAHAERFIRYLGAGPGDGRPGPATQSRR